MAREHQRRKDAREAEVRAAHPRVGELLLKVSRAPQREAAFRRGELGELAVGEMLNKRAAKGSLRALHDRRVPGRQGNIDHIAVAPSGVYVIDAKHYSGKVRREDRGWRRRRWRRSSTRSPSHCLQSSHDFRASKTSRLRAGARVVLGVDDWDDVARGVSKSG